MEMILLSIMFCQEDQSTGCRIVIVLPEVGSLPAIFATLKLHAASRRGACGHWPASAVHDVTGAASATPTRLLPALFAVAVVQLAPSR